MRKRSFGQRGGQGGRNRGAEQGQDPTAGTRQPPGPGGKKPRRIEKRFPEAGGAIVGKAELRAAERKRERAAEAAETTIAAGPAEKSVKPPLPIKPGSGRPTDEMRIAKAMARAGLCSRREAERWIAEGRVRVNGETIHSPALDVSPKDKISVDGELLPDAEPPRLWRYHKPRGLVTTHKDPEGRPTVFDALPRELGRVISIGRLDYNTEGLLLLTNDGALARHLELPSTGWLRKYRVRAHGVITQARLDALKDGIEIEGVQYGPIEATLDSQQGANSWLTLGLREGKNREVRNILGSLGLAVNRLIRISYGPFQLLDLEEGKVEGVKRRVLEEQLGPTLSKELGVSVPERDKSTAQKARRVPERRREAGKERR